MGPEPNANVALGFVDVTADGVGNLGGLPAPNING